MRKFESKNSIKDTKKNPFLQTLDALPRIDEIHYRYNAISMFCGGGGLDLGASFAGFKIEFASDLEPQHCETIAFNFPDCKTLPIDIKELTKTKIKSMINNHEVDLLAGGPPCQSFSILGKRNSFSDPRGMLVYEYARIVTEIQPKAFIFENVPGLLNVNHGKDWHDLLEFFTNQTGYTLYTQKLNAADYGVPQIRNRIFIVGFKDSHVKFSFPKATHENPDRNQLPLLGQSTDTIIPWVPSKYALELVDGLPNQRIRPHGERVKNRYDLIIPGERDRIDHTDRINPEKPSGTVLVGSRAGGGRPFIHPIIPRHITVREAARLQSFPDWFEFQNSETWQYRAVGNAVPPLLGKAVCESIATALDNL